MIRVGLTGAPSCGKTSVIHILREKGFVVFSEAATQIIENERQKGREVADIVRDQDFQARIHALKLQQFADAQDHTGTVFFDTTFVDDIAHRRATGVETKSIEESVRTYRYDVMFLLEHPGVVENNGIRTENFDEIMKLDVLKREALKEFGYTPFFVPPSSKSDVWGISERVNILLSRIESIHF